MIKEYLHMIYDELYYFVKITVNYDNFWLITGFVVAAGLVFYLFLRTPKV